MNLAALDDREAITAGLDALEGRHGRRHRDLDGGPAEDRYRSYRALGLHQ